MEPKYNEIELRRLDLNLLLVFGAVVRAGSVRAAAQRLYIGSSAVSMALKRLRDALGQDLFVRGRSGLEPTPFAKAFYARVSPALDDIGNALGEGRIFDPATADRGFRLAMSDDLEIVLAPILLGRLRRDAPGVSLVIRTSDFKSAARMLDDGGADLALSARPIGLEARHRVETLYRESLVALWDGSKLDLPDPLSLESYLGAPHALVSAGGGLRGLIDEQLAEQGLSRRVVIAVERFSTLIFLLGSAAVVAAVPRMPALRFAAELGLRWRPLPFASPTFDVVAAWHARVDSDPAHAWFRRLVLEEARILSKI